MWTVGDILPEIARHVDGNGVCLDTPAGKARALAAYNRVCEELMADDAWDGATADVEFGVCEDYFSLPSHFETLKAVTLNRVPSAVRPGGWRYLQQGPLLANGSGLNEVHDLGDHFATARDLSVPMQLMVSTNRPESGNAHAILHGTTPEGVEIGRGQFPGMVPEPGERIQIVGAGFAPVGGTKAQPFVTRAIFDRRPTMVIKPMTNGIMTIHGYRPNEPVEWLSSCHPDETRPSYRRYRLNRTSTEPVQVIGKVALRFVPATHEGERAMIQFRPPFGIYVQALEARDAGRFDEYQRYRNSAISKLKRQREVKIEGQTHMLSVSAVRSGSSLRVARRR